MKTDENENEATCRICGCTDNNACWGGCYWVEDDLCSKCVALHCTIFYAMQLNDRTWIGQTQNEKITRYMLVTNPDQIGLFATEDLAIDALDAIQLSENTIYDNAHLFEVIHEN